MRQRGQGGRGDRRWLPGALASGQALAAARPGREGRAQAASRFGNARESVGEMREGSLWSLDDLVFDGAEIEGDWRSERLLDAA